MSNARIYSNCPGPKVHSASNDFKSPVISDPVPVRAGDGVDIDRCITTQKTIFFFWGGGGGGGGGVA